MYYHVRDTEPSGATKSTRAPTGPECVASDQQVRARVVHQAHCGRETTAGTANGGVAPATVSTAGLPTGSTWEVSPSRAALLRGRG